MIGCSPSVRRQIENTRYSRTASSRPMAKPESPAASLSCCVKNRKLNSCWIWPAGFIRSLLAKSGSIPRLNRSLHRFPPLGRCSAARPWPGISPVRGFLPQRFSIERCFVLVKTPTPSNSKLRPAAERAGGDKGDNAQFGANLVVRRRLSLRYP